MRHIFNFFAITLYSMLGLSAGAILVIAAAYLYLGPKLPSVETLREIQLQIPLRIYSADNQFIGEFGEKRRTPVIYDNVPKQFIHAILAAEDDRFYQHHGVDIKGLMRAASQLLATGQIQTGGSTITMQVAKNFFLSPEKTFFRKFNEIFLALQIERELSKKEILELYINKIYLGHRAYGIQAAAQVYYGTSIDQLSLAQLAMIAGLPKAPSSFNPIANPSRAKLRRNWILKRMLLLSYVNNEQYELAIKAPISALHHGLSIELDAPYVAEMVRKGMVERYGKNAYTEGFKVYTTINSRLQKQAQDSVINGLLTYDKRHGYRGSSNHFSDASTWLTELSKLPVFSGLEPAIVTQIEEKHLIAMLADGNTVQLDWEDGISSARPYIDQNQRGPSPTRVEDVCSVGDVIRLNKSSSGRWQFSQIPAAQAALVALSPKDGAIISLVGGFDYYHSKFNRAIQANRQPGSNFKPLIYAAAVTNGFTAATLINDAPVVFNDASLEGAWRPANDSGKFHGLTRLRKALYKSRNLVSIRLLRELGIANAINYISRFGFDESKLPHDLSLALGSHALPPIKMATAYASFANGGYLVEPYLIDKILDAGGNTAYQANPLTVCTDCEDANKTASAKELATIEEILAKPAATERPAAPRIIEKRVAYIMDSILKDVIKRGTGRRALALNRNDIAGKTGTTNGPTDAWFSGYHPDIVTTTWLGFDNNKKLGRREYGGSAALPIWIAYMREALRDLPEKSQKQPKGIITVLIDPQTGKRATPGQTNALFEIFRTEYAPTKQAEQDHTTEDDNAPLIPEELF